MFGTLHENGYLRARFRGSLSRDKVKDESGSFIVETRHSVYRKIFSGAGSGNPLVYIFIS